MKRLLAFDFGASSGRAILGEYDNGTLTYQEIHRFDNIPIEQNEHLRWNFTDLMQNVYKAIEKAGQVDSIGFDTWGVDFGLLDKEGNLLEQPIHYRDQRTKHTVQKALQTMDANEIYQATGNQIMNINTLFQMMETDLQGVDKILFMPDLFAYHLCKTMVCEKSIASTSQMFDLSTGDWSKDILNTYHIPSVFAPLVESGTVIGEYQGAKVVAVAGHDTQSAIAAMPTQQKDAAFLSCGTWSLFGCELDQPILNEQSQQLNLSNEMGANGKVNYLKNITGLWLIQESRRQWQREGQEYSFGELAQLAEQSQPMQCFIDTDAEEFSAPGNLPKRIQEYCQRTGQFVPQTVGEFSRCIYESLAMKYRETFHQIQKITDKKFSVLHILGGGCQAKLLCQMTADALGIQVKAGPVEATALGNLLLQLKALGEVESIDQGRALIERIEPIQEYFPCNTEQWEKAVPIYEKICKQGGNNNDVS